MLQDLPKEDHNFRANILDALGGTYRRNGRWEEASACYLKVFDLVHAPAFPIRSVHAFGALVDLELQQGRLRDSAAYWRKALAVIQEPQTWGSFPLPLIGWVFIRLGEILYEWNELGEASDHVSRGLERSELGGDVRAMIAGYLMAGRLKLTAGGIAAAGECLERARHGPHRRELAGMATRAHLRRCRARRGPAANALRVRHRGPGGHGRPCEARREPAAPV